VNAWLLTWVGTLPNLPDERIVAILSSRRSDRAIAELMELLVLRATSGAKFAAFCANRPKELVYKAQTPLPINRVPHGNRVVCGHDPWLYGRKVKDLKVTVEESTGDEIVSWREPDDFRFRDEERFDIEIATAGAVVSIRRRRGALSGDIDKAPCAA
jgi:hypothetical protein